MWCENQISSHPVITLRIFSQLSLHLLRHNKPCEKILSAYCRRKKVNPWWTSVVFKQYLTTGRRLLQLTLQTDSSSTLKQQNWAVLLIKMTEVRLKPSPAKGLGVIVLHPSAITVFRSAHMTRKKMQKCIRFWFTAWKWSKKRSSENIQGLGCYASDKVKGQIHIFFFSSLLNVPWPFTQSL